ncbi:Ig-like domain-containing protein [uncultured Brevibacillus sp.]|uniref:Ig-like domain-containing protein n=1 Tax=uncultured Brevibacillus sp. TaxID=169970 RepID=UPI0033907147
MNVAENFSDPDEDPLTFTASSSDASIATVNFIEPGFLEFHSVYRKTGVVTVTVTATDDNGASVWSAFKVTLS